MIDQGQFPEKPRNVLEKLDGIGRLKDKTRHSQKRETLSETGRVEKRGKPCVKNN